MSLRRALASSETMRQEISFRRDAETSTRDERAPRSFAIGAFPKVRTHTAGAHARIAKHRWASPHGRHAIRMSCSRRRCQINDAGANCLVLGNNLLSIHERIGFDSIKRRHWVVCHPALAALARPGGGGALSNLKLSGRDLNRADVLAEKAGAGKLTDEDAVELENYRTVGPALEFLKAKARRTLKTAAN